MVADINDVWSNYKQTDIQFISEKHTHFCTDHTSRNSYHKYNHYKKMIAMSLMTATSEHLLMTTNHKAWTIKLVIPLIEKCYHMLASETGRQIR